MRYLIGGVPTSGKTTIAIELAKQLGISTVSTDVIRAYTIEILGRKNYFAKLPSERNLNIEEYLGEHTAEEISARELAKNELLASYMPSWFKSDWGWKNYVVEGTGILPSEINNWEDECTLKAIFLCYRKRDVIKERIYSRGLWDDADK